MRAVRYRDGEIAVFRFPAAIQSAAPAKGGERLVINLTRQKVPQRGIANAAAFKRKGAGIQNRRGIAVLHLERRDRVEDRERLTIRIQALGQTMRCIQGGNEYEQRRDAGKG